MPWSLFFVDTFHGYKLDDNWPIMTAVTRLPCCPIRWSVECGSSKYVVNALIWSWSVIPAQRCQIEIRTCVAAAVLVFIPHRFTAFSATLSSVTVSSSWYNGWCLVCPTEMSVWVLGAHRPNCWHFDKMATSEAIFATLRSAVLSNEQVPASAADLTACNPLIVRDTKERNRFNLCLNGRTVGRMHEPLGICLASLLDAKACRMTG